MVAFVVDVNVAVVANGRNTPQADNLCKRDCIRALRDVMQSIICMDKQDYIIKEYRDKLSMSGQPGAGDEFMAWMAQNQYNEKVCELVDITPHRGRGFYEFPDDVSLAGFDSDDRMYVAVALKSTKNPVILNAVDSDWDIHSVALAAKGLRINELCPHCLKNRM
jgi:hypothetical protein